MKKRKLNTNEKFLISFIVVLMLAIATSWSSFVDRIGKVMSTYKIDIEQTK